eukprot:5718072-Karenia_brevis.AAC.1
MVVQWKPQGAYRSVGHPKKKWHDDLDAFFRRKSGSSKGLWLAVAQDRDKWKALECQYAYSC